MASDILGQYGDLPVEAPPPGIIANFTNPESNAFQLIIVAAVSLGLIILFYGCRIAATASGILSRRSLCTEGILFLAIFLSATYSASTIATVKTGPLGKHEWDIQVKEVTKTFAILDTMTELLWAISIGFVKVSLLLMYLEIFKRISWLRRGVYIGIVLIIVCHLVSTIALGIMCGPQPGYGHSRLGYLLGLSSNRCRSSRTVGVVQGCYGILIDLYLMILPLPAVGALHLPLKRKLGVAAMFLTGLVALTASCIGLYYRVRLQELPGDQTHDSIPTWCSTFGELTAGILVLCMPAMTQLFKKTKKHARPTSTIGSTSNPNQVTTNVSRISRTGWFNNRAQDNSSDNLNHNDIEKSSSNQDGINAEFRTFFVSGKTSRAKCWADSGSDNSSFENGNPANHSWIKRKTEIEIRVDEDV